MGLFSWDRGTVQVASHYWSAISTSESAAMVPDCALAMVLSFFLWDADTSTL